MEAVFSRRRYSRRQHGRRGPRPRNRPRSGDGDGRRGRPVAGASGRDALHSVAAQQPKRYTQMTQPLQTPTPPEASGSRSILIIEDNETLALGLRTSLEVEGYKVTSVTDGNEGLAWLDQYTLDLVVLDLMLPGMNGFEVLRRYRGAGGRAAVLILSARDQEVDKVQ